MHRAAPWERTAIRQRIPVQSAQRRETWHALIRYQGRACVVPAGSPAATALAAVLVTNVVR